MTIGRVAVLAILGVFAALSSTRAAEPITQSADGSIRLSGGIGLLDLKAHEFVYDGASKLSQLDWESRAVTLYTVSVGADLDPDWTLQASLRYGDGGDGGMTDYDWIEPFNNGTSKDGWSDRSIHPDTRLKYYIDGDVSLARSVYRTDTATLGLTGGFRYTDVRWDAYGGSYIYSVLSPRDSIGNFDDDERGVSYRQRIPVFFTGITGAATVDRFGFSGSAKVGLTPGINDIDYHWIRDLRFDDRMNPAPVALLSAEVTYALTGEAGLYLGASFENVFRKRGDVQMRDRVIGDSAFFENEAGASFRSIAVSFGVKGAF
ncbi:hypothetical protein ASG39_07085 [Rhizobium sp. Leaf371]|uniref:omptin family outer membrane protease n=1 Tax=Rhizobium sp. Leaf371 TaxID=1736355 RepID=UPI0007124705|nr:omptin family outer membrane protease [Rhizobium sp. Leaf371]KQS68082.1 hypothetical protein ASG39_07085 [Rhizobium sp. Leaf371]